jgi:hypothetical protein
MIYKDYTIKRGERGHCEIIDAQGKVVALMSMVIECKRFIDSMVRAA